MIDLIKAKTACYLRCVCFVSERHRLCRQNGNENPQRSLAQNIYFICPFVEMCVHILTHDPLNRRWGRISNALGGRFVLNVQPTMLDLRSISPQHQFVFQKEIVFSYKAYKFWFWERKLYTRFICGCQEN